MSELIKRRVFKSNEHQAEYERVGFISAPILSPEEISQANQFLESLNSGIKSGFYASLNSSSLEFRRKAHDYFSGLIGDRIKIFFDNYKHIMFTPTIKLPGPDSAFGLHADDEHVDESKYRSINVWTALVDMKVENGALQILPGSHNLPYPIRGIGLPFAYESLIPKFKDQLVSQNIPAGTALFFDSRIIHGSPINSTDSIRSAFLTGLIPQESDPIVYLKHHLLARDEVELMEGPGEFYLRAEIEKKPEGFKSLGIFTLPDFQPSEDDFFKTIADSLKTETISSIQTPGPSMTETNKVLPPFLKFEELDYRADWSFADGLNQIQNRKIDGFWIRNVLSEPEVAQIVNFTNSLPESQRLKETQGWVYPTGFAAAVEGLQSQTEVKSYFQEMNDFGKQLPNLLGFDFVKRIEGILSKLNGGMKVMVPEGLENQGQFTPVQIRLLYSDHPGIPLHCGNVFKQMYPGYYDLLSEKVNTQDQMSFFMVLQKPGQSGELTVFDLEWEEGQEMANFDEMKLASGEIVNPSLDSRYKAWKIPPMVGDLFVFAGGQIWHQVEPIIGSTDRITIAGFFAFSKDGDIVYHWA